LNLTIEYNGFIFFKVRYIIEKQNSLLKNKKALENIRNTQVGHILVDYRICCAMANFNLIPSITDSNYTIEIAKRIKRRSLKKQNKLSHLQKMTLPDFKSQTSLDIKSVDDFPQLSLSQFKRYITLGSYKIRQCKSYIDQFIKNGKIFFINEQQLIKHNIHQKVQNEFKETKILAVFILSRHKRGKKLKKCETSDCDPVNFTFFYKVFIQYKSLAKNVTKGKPYKNIKSNSELFFYL